MSNNVSRPSLSTLKLETELSPPLVVKRNRQSGLSTTLPAPSKAFGALSCPLIGLKVPGTGAAGSGTFHLCNRAIRTSTIVDDAVLDLIGLHIEMSANHDSTCSSLLTYLFPLFVPLSFFSLEIGCEFFCIHADRNLGS